MALKTDIFELTFEDDKEIRLRWKLDASEYVIIVEMEENGNLGSIIDSFATVANTFFAARVSNAVNAMK